MPASKSSNTKPAAKPKATAKAAPRPSAAKKAAVKKPAAKKAPAKKAPVGKTLAKKTAVKKAPARTTAAKKETVKKTVAKKAATKKAPPAKKLLTKKVPAKKAPGPRPGAQAALTKPAAGKAAAKAPVAKAPVAKKAAVKKPAAKKANARAAIGTRPLAVNPDQPEISFGFAGPLKGFQPYQPARGEEYMSEGMLGHFREILLAWKQELMEEVDRTVHHMKDEAANFPDPNDRATQESEFGLELRTRDRERKLLKKIEQALARIDDGTYGYCSETGEEIGLRRLEARPVATLTVEAQERRELAEKQYRDRDDR
jgi:DnaK suppressor protein